MGAWGHRVFENDDAADWADRFEGKLKPAVVTKALAIPSRRGTDSERGSLMLAAAEVVAASRGRACADLPDAIAEWLQTTGFQADDEFAAHAVLAVDYVLDSSELRELWSASSAWRRSVQGLRQRLKAPSKFAGAATPKPEGSDRSGKGAGLTEAKRAAKAMGAHLSVDKSGEVDLRVRDDISDDQLVAFLLGRTSVLSRLESLVLNYEGIGDRSIEVLTKLPGLSSLYLDGSAVTNGGMKAFKQFPSLKYLSIAGTRVGDSGLMELVGSRLVCVALHKTKVTAAGLDRFRKAMPGCFVGPSWEWGDARAAAR